MKTAALENHISEGNTLASPQKPATAFEAFINAWKELEQKPEARLGDFIGEWKALEDEIALMTGLEGFIGKWNVLESKLAPLAGLETFISKWKELESKLAPLADLGNFIGEWKALENAEALPDFLKNFTSVRESELKSGNCVDLFAIDEIGRQEKRYSAYLAWLLDARADHGQGDIFLREFLKQAQPDFLENVREGDKYSVRTEDQVSENSRFDISLEGTEFLLGIEVKIGAEESADQLKKYAESLRKKAVRTGKKFLLVYLTVDGRQGSSEEAVPFSWRGVANVLSRGVKQLEEKNSNFSQSLAFQVITQFRDRIRNL